jgi:hypothetical protein
MVRRIHAFVPSALAIAETAARRSETHKHFRKINDAGGTLRNSAPPRVGRAGSHPEIGFREDDSWTQR